MSEKHEEKVTVGSWFGRWFINNKYTIVMLNVLLTVLVLWALNRVSFIFDPVAAFIGAVLPAIILAAVQYYLMNPLVDMLEHKYHVPRTVTIIVLFLLVVGLIIWAAVTLIPMLQSQIQGIIDNWPAYWKATENAVSNWLSDPQMKSLRTSLQNYSDQIQNTLLKSANSAVSDTVTHLSTAVNVITVVFMTVLTAPIVLFYMLKDGRQLKGKLAYFFPIKYRAKISDILSDINSSIAAYVRGQLIVAFWVGVMFSIGYSVVGLNYGLTLGIVAAVLNLIPYFGTFVAIIPAFIIALFDSTGMLFKVIIVFAIEQTVESKVVSPLVLGNKMNMHPITTILVLVGASAVWGLWGVIFAIPIYAIFKIAFQRIFDSYRVRSGLYTDDLIAEGLVVKPQDDVEPPLDKED